jgi:hypothetical protein
MISGCRLSESVDDPSRMALTFRSDDGIALTSTFWKVDDASRGTLTLALLFEMRITRPSGRREWQRDA